MMRARKLDWSESALRDERSFTDELNVTRLKTSGEMCGT